MIMLSNDVYRECVKALAYGKTPKEIAQVMSVDERDVKAIPHSHVKAEREYLVQMGFIK